MPGSADAWFDGVFAEHSTAVYRYFARRAAPSDVEDLTADVFVTAWRRRSEVPVGAELPWLYRTAGYLLANHRRKASAIPVERLPDTGVDDIQWRVGTQDIATVLARLSDRDRRILLLSAWEGLQGQQLADVLEVSRTAADTALSRARSRLRDAWAALDRA